MDFKQTKDELITQGLISSTEDLILCEDAPSNFDERLHIKSNLQ